MSDVKRCSCCGRVLPVGSFYRSSRNPDGLQCWCKECQHVVQRSTRSRRSASRLVSSSADASAACVLSKADMRAQNIKLCVRCQTVKPLSSFSPDPHNRDGHKSWCKSCCSSYVSARHASCVTELRKKAIKDGLSLHVPSRRVVARNGVPVSEPVVPKNLKPLSALSSSLSSSSAPSVTTELSTDGTAPLDSKDAVNPLFSGISSRELLEELEARGFDLRGACHVEIRVVRSVVKL